MNITCTAKALLLASLMLTANALTAAQRQDPDASAPIHITADRLEADQKSGHARYIGHVRLKQGRFELLADTLDVWVESGRLDKAIARGKPARFRKFDADSGKWVHGEALTIRYTVEPERTLVLEQKAQVRRDGGERLEGERITYSLDANRLSAESGGKKQVHVVLPPDGRQGADTP